MSRCLSNNTIDRTKPWYDHWQSTREICFQLTRVSKVIVLILSIFFISNFVFDEIKCLRIEWLSCLMTTSLLFYKWDTNSCALTTVWYSHCGNNAHNQGFQHHLHHYIPPAWHNWVSKTGVQGYRDKRSKAGTDRFTWQTQHGSASSLDSVSTEYFFCFKSFITFSSLNPVLTFPIRSSKANNSYNHICELKEIIVKWIRNFNIRRIKQSTDYTQWKPNVIFSYLIRHVINIKTHISVSIMNISHSRKDWMVKNHDILWQSQSIDITQII